MPKAALLTGSVDLTLSSSDIGTVLPRLLEHPTDFSELLTQEHRSDEYGRIYNIVRNNTAFKLADYKSATVKRRIARRMSLLGIYTLEDYAEYLKNYKEESHLLVRDTFISVTYFFRDKDAFSALEDIINASINNHNNRNKIIRCWIPGCASGEEVYSIAMLFEEAFRKQQRADLEYMIFASDLDDAAVERARIALYPSSEMETVPKEFLDLYTEKIGEQRRIKKRIRNRIVFTRQNVIEDPPFGRMDLISCRNLLIYLTPEAQKKVLYVFHYALNPTGHLFLGKSENLDLFKDIFETNNRKAHIYTPKAGEIQYTLPISQEVPLLNSQRSKNRQNVATSTDYISMRTLEELTQCYAPPSLVIDESNEIIHFEGNLKPYLSFPKGRAEMYLFDMVLESLRTELRALIYRCRRTANSAEGTPKLMGLGSKQCTITPIVRPLEHGRGSLLLISFVTEAVDQRKKNLILDDKNFERENLIISELEQELTNTRTHLNIVVEELETSNEELQSLNEELQSANEELQSTNEELQTSNEELQSTNEELLTVNEELQVKSTELERTTFDLINVKQSLDFPLIVVNTQLRITQTNSACADVADFQNPLEGSSLNSVQWLVEIPGLYNNVHKVIRESTSLETKIHYPEKQTVFHLFIMPYRNSLNQIDGAILLFTNVSALHSAEIAFAESEIKFHQAMLHAPIGIALQSPDGHYLEVNPALCEILGYTADELLTRDLQSVTHPDDLDITMEYIYRMLSNEIDSHYLDKRFIHKDGHIVWATLHKAIVRDSNNRPKYFIALIVDITNRRIAEEELRLAASVFSNAMDGIIITDNRARIIKVNKAFENMLGYTSSDVIGQHTRILRSYRHDDDFYRAMWGQIHEKGSWTGEIWDRHKEGHIVPIWLSISALKDSAGKVDHYIAVMYDISELKQYHERMHHLAHYDGLTKLPNRMLFTDRLKHAIDIAKRSNFSLALLFVDLDNFKHINDARGHHIGDELICQVADKLSQITRSTDTVARLSGDEFIILLENQLTKDKVCMIAEKAIASISESMELSDGPAFISASIGIAFYPDDGEDIESLLQHSDLAMYRAKESGRNHFVFYQPEMSQKMHERILLKTDLHQALHQQKLQFNYQPIINIYSKEYMGAEALLRWKHPKLGWISPEKFIPIAEESDLIHKIGEWALSHACQQIRKWLDLGFNPGVLSVNVSGKQFTMANFHNVACEILKNTNCPAENILLEITENFLMEESDAALVTLNNLRELGFNIAIDDFGTGYSSLSYLKRLPINKIKLDKSFVRDLPSNTNAVAIARAILSMGKTLGFDVIAEGIENRDQNKFLLTEECKYGQGFYYAKPMSAEKLVIYVSKNKIKYRK